jgi:hypothetical protein
MVPTYTEAATLIARIASANRELATVNQAIATIESKLAAENNEIETAIAYNSQLKNDAQRKIARYDVQQGNPIWMMCESDLADRKLEKAELHNNIDEWRNTLTNIQLELRRAIVAQETANIEQINLR